MPVQDVFIYGLVDPRDNEIYYVGQSSDPQYRLSQHLREKRNRLKAEWIRELALLGLVPDIQILEVCDSEDWVTNEKKWIAYGRKDGWPLVNLTSGGEGSSIDYRAWAGLKEHVVPLIGRERELKALSTSYKVELLCKVALAVTPYLKRYFVQGEKLNSAACNKSMQAAAEKFLRIVA